MTSTYAAFKAYDRQGNLRHVGSGTALAVPSRFDIDKVETFTFPTSAAAIAFIVAETAKVAR